MKIEQNQHWTRRHVILSATGEKGNGFVGGAHPDHPESGLYETVFKEECRGVVILHIQNYVLERRQDWHFTPFTGPAISYIAISAIWKTDPSDQMYYIFLNGKMLDVDCQEF
jgi:hypothetical protein